MSAGSASAYTLSEFDSWVARTEGTYVNVDGAYGAQCWDLWEAYCRDLVGVSGVSTQLSPNPGYASALWDGYSSNGASNYFDTVAGNATPVKGDVAIWQYGTGYYPYSHVAIVLADAGENLYVFSQNSSASLANNPYPGQSTGPSIKQYLPKSGIAGYLRPRTLSGGSPSPTLSSARLAISDASGNISMKEGHLYAGWTTVSNSARSFSISGTRVGVVSSSGVASIKEGAINAGWTTLDTNSLSINVTPGRIGILRANKELWVKEGPVNASWVIVASNVDDFSLDGNRIGVISGGTARVKDGPLNAPWTTQTTGSSRIQVNGNRIGLLQNDGSLIVKDGDLYASWTTQLTGVSQFHLAGNRIGVVAGGVASVKDGNLYASWVNQTSGAREVQVTPTRVGIVGVDGKALAKDGNLYAPWVELTTGVGSMRLAN